MVLKVGKGIIITRPDGSADYKGSLPEGAEREPVVILRESDLDLLIRGDIRALLTQQHPMAQEFYTLEDTSAPFFEDRIRYIHPTGQEVKLFLDRKLYSPDLSKMIFVRYVSVDQASFEELSP